MTHTVDLCLLSSQHNQDQKHRTYVYVLIVTEILEDWEDSVTIGTASCHLNTNTKLFCLMHMNSAIEDFKYPIQPYK